MTTTPESVLLISSIAALFALAGIAASSAALAADALSPLIEHAATDILTAVTELTAAES